MESTFSDFFPDLFNRIHLGRIRWDVEKNNILRQFQACGFMPCRAVTAKQDNVLRILFRQFLQKDIHAHRIAIRHDEEISFSSRRLYCSIGITILPNVVTGYAGTYSFLTPAVFGFVNSSKASLILKQQADFLPLVDNF